MPNSKNYDLDIDTTLGGNNASDYVIPSQKAIKDYVDNHSGGGTVDQTYDSTSANAQSGVAIAGAKFLQNKATGTGGLTIIGTASTAQYAINLGTSSTAGNSAVAVGYSTAANGARSVSIGYNARIGSSTVDAIQIGYGTNSTAFSFNVGFYNNSSTHYNWQLLDGTTGLIPDDRISSNIARTSQIPDISGLESASNKVTSISSSSTDSQYPSAKLLYDTVGNIESALHAINSGV